MKKSALILLSLISLNSFAQIDIDEIIGTPFNNNCFENSAFADIDNDGDQDLLMAGDGAAMMGCINLYKNDGNGNYTIVSGITFINVHQASINFADVDGDNDLDVLITGNASTGGFSTNLYLNNGTGIFSLNPATPFLGIGGGDAAFFDIDGDNDQDLVLTGATNNGASGTEGTIKLYKNNGSGVFTEQIGQLYEDPLTYGENIDVADVDGDNDLDFVIYGSYLTALYTNNGSGIFTKSNPFTSLSAGNLTFFDADSDNDKDIIMTGYSGMGIETKLYINNGNGFFTEDLNNQFIGMAEGSVINIDVDSDNDEDLIITGNTTSMSPVSTATNLYINDGLGNFTIYSPSIFSESYQGEISISDIDGDNDYDVLLSGTRGTNNDIPFVKLYENNSCPESIASIGSFTKNPICLKDNPTPIPTGSPSGGIYFGLGVNGSSYNPDWAGLGIHTIDYVYTDNNGCVDTASTDIEVISSPSYTYQTTGNSVTLSSTSSCSNFYWDFGDGNTNSLTTNPAHTYPTNGIYTICFVCDDITSCASCINLTFPSNTSGSFNGAIGVEENNYDKKTILVQPNPTSGKFIIDLNGFRPEIISLFDIRGKKIEELTMSNKEVNISHLESVFYLLKISTKASTQTVKILKR